jgi:hypothetical protein
VLLCPDWVIWNAPVPVLTLMHCGVVAPQTLFMTMNSPCAALTLSNRPHSSWVCALAGVATATIAAVSTIVAALSVASSRNRRVVAGSSLRGPHRGRPQRAHQSAN